MSERTGVDSSKTRSNLQRFRGDLGFLHKGVKRSEEVMNRSEAEFPVDRYERRPPPPPLSDYVQELYFYRGAAPYPVSTITHMPALHLLFNLGATISMHTPDGSDVPIDSASGLLLGPQTAYRTIIFPPKVRIYGVRFNPAAAHPFLNFPLSELRDQSVPAGLVWGEVATRVSEQLDAAPSVEAAFAILERFLLSRFHDAPYGLSLVRRSIDEIARHHGSLSIPALAAEVGLSHNQMGRQFKRIAGVTPKVMARFYRIAGALRSLAHAAPEHAVDLTAVAYRWGFYDQSHFIREIRAFTGHSPTELLQCTSTLRIEMPVPAIPHEAVHRLRL